MENIIQTSAHEPKIFNKAPEGFNPMTASERELIIYGYPPRPDSKTNPNGAQLWERVFSKNPTILIPEIKTIELKENINTSPNHPDTLSQTSKVFAGSIISGISNNSVLSIRGEWNIPTCTPTPAEQAIGGYYNLRTCLMLHAQPLSASLGVLNYPGVLNILGFTVHSQVSKAYYYIGNSINFIENFPVYAGQTILAVMCYNYSTKIVTFWLLNVTTNVFVPIIPPVALNANVTNGVAWQVDSNTLNNAGLPNFTPITFKLAEADIKNAQGSVDIVGADTGHLYTLVDISGKALATTTIVAPNTITVKYTG